MHPQAISDSDSDIEYSDNDAVEYSAVPRVKALVRMNAAWQLQCLQEQKQKTLQRVLQVLLLQVLQVCCCCLKLPHLIMCTT